jgi:hypothetical protein
MRNMRPLVVLAVLFALAACAQPPQAEIDAAKAALDAAARSTDVDIYAPDQLRAAQERMAGLDAEIGAQAKRSALSRNYDTAKSLALDVAVLAKASVDAAVISKQQVAKDAVQIADDLTAAIPAFERKVWNARGVRRINLDIITPLQPVPEAARQTVADARKDIESGAYATAKAKLLAVKDQIASCEETITEQTRIARSR